MIKTSGQREKAELAVGHQACPAQLLCSVYSCCCRRLWGVHPLQSSLLFGSASSAVTASDQNQLHGACQHHLLCITSVQLTNIVQPAGTLSRWYVCSVQQSLKCFVFRQLALYCLRLQLQNEGAAEARAVTATDVYVRQAAVTESSSKVGAGLCEHTCTDHTSVSNILELITLGSSTLRWPSGSLPWEGWIGSSRSEAALVVLSARMSDVMS
jgi:hypothetical protein